MEPAPTTIDLDPAGDAWSRLRPPAGWAPIAALAQAVAADLDAVAARVMRRLRAEIPAYRDAPVPDSDLAGSIARTSEAVLLGLAERRGPTRHEVAVRRELGRRRAHQGVRVDDLLTGYRVGYEELWRALVAEVEAHRPELATRLLGEATLLWQWVQELTDAVGAAHAATLRELQAQRISARQRLLELLASPGDGDDLEARRLAAALDLDPDGELRAVLVHSVADEPDALALQGDLAALPGRCVVAARGSRLLVMAQGADVGAVAERCLRAAATAGVAVGLARHGLPGARASLVDAELALALEREQAPGGIAWFEQDWLWATLRASRDRLEAVLRPGAEVAAGHPHLAAAVTAFAGGGFSASAAARELRVHPNTVTYRLDRWASLSGWDPRTFEGLVRSLAALRLPTPAPTRGPEP